MAATGICRLFLHCYGFLCADRRYKIYLRNTYNNVRGEPSEGHGAGMATSNEVGS